MTEKERRDDLFRKIRKLTAYREIQNLMGRLTASLNFQRADELCHREGE